jgi:2-amino-4-hydroxy-6-hydroxymethyldihydropteridine diphosphokinase
VVARSSVYETGPQGEVTDQPDFLNAVVRIDTDLRPEELLAACKAIEDDLGREPQGVRHGPRAIDLDVLLLGQMEHHAGGVTLPHPEIPERRFVLEPLLELDPRLVLPDGTHAADALERVRGQRAERVGVL